MEGLRQYLLERRHLPLAGLGVLSVEKKPSEYSAEDQIIYPPKIIFHWVNEEDEPFSLQPVLGYLSQFSGQTEEECFDQYHTFCNQVKQDLHLDGYYEINSLGKIVHISGGKVEFEPVPDFENYQSPVQGIRAIHEGRSHDMKVGDLETNTKFMQERRDTQLEEEMEPVSEGRWWLPGLILGLGAITLITLRLLKVL